MINRSDDINELAKSLCAAQGELTVAHKNADNPQFKSKFANLDSCIAAIRVPFCKNNLSYSQHPEVDGTTVKLETILMHSSGQWMSSIITMKVVRDTPQGIGSCITYARRYALCAIAGLAPGDDDDGNAASGLNESSKQTASGLNKISKQQTELFDANNTESVENLTKHMIEKGIKIDICEALVKSCDRKSKAEIFKIIQENLK